MLMEEHLSDLARTIQLAVAPVFLLTALGTILNVFSNRLGRIVDRTRSLLDRLPELHGDDKRQPLMAELSVLGRRRRLVNHAITFATTSSLLVCLLIAFAFVGFMLHFNFAYMMALFFIAAMAAFVAGLVFFLREVLLAVSTTSDHAP
jgi:hypothetical protein